MSKNIVLCSDGTGNRGGKGQDTNVWRIYQAVDLHNLVSDTEQIAFYDDGVGTEDNKYLRLIGGAAGLGFTRNVKDLYKFLVKHYESGADIYLFGFSRGAYTVRALAAFVTACGIIRFPTEKCATERELGKAIDQLVDNYHHWRSAPKSDDAPTAGGDAPKLPPKTDIHDAKTIRCIGVWDTVSAIGVPFDSGLKRLIYRIFKFRFRDAALNENVTHGFQALALDDARRSFRPVMWKGREHVEQVWFVGVHSNVGGGYPKQGMAYVALDWMMEKVALTPEKGWGLNFDKGLREAARHHANVHDKLYDSRAGHAAYYRYEPRDIVKLMEAAEASVGAAQGQGQKAVPTPKDPVAMHDSVFDRLEGRTLGYSPGNMPSERAMRAVTTSGAPPDTALQGRLDDAARTNRRKALRGKIESIIAGRKALHLAFVLFSLLIATGLAHFLVMRPDTLPVSDTVTPQTPLKWILLYLRENWIPAIAAAVTIVLMCRLKRARYIFPCVLVLLALAWFTLTPAVWSGGMIRLWDWVPAVLAFLLPDVVAAAATYFIALFPFGVIGAVLTIAGLVGLNLRSRTKADEIHEQACDTLR